MKMVFGLCWNRAVGTFEVISVMGMENHGWEEQLSVVLFQHTLWPRRGDIRHRGDPATSDVASGTSVSSPLTPHAQGHPGKEHELLSPSEVGAHLKILRQSLNFRLHTLHGCDYGMNKGKRSALQSTSCCP